MSDKILQRLIQRGITGESSIDDSELTGEEAESLGCFGWLRGVRERTLAIEFRKKSGHTLAINSSFLSKFEYEPTTGITLHATSGQLITIRGVNLNSEVKPGIRLFQGLARFRVPWLAEAEREQAFAAGKDAVVVESIQW